MLKLKLISLIETDKIEILRGGYIELQRQLDNERKKRIDYQARYTVLKQAHEENLPF
jgi:hypothetical protein